MLTQQKIKRTIWILSPILLISAYSQSTGILDKDCGALEENKNFQNTENSEDIIGKVLSNLNRLESKKRKRKSTTTSQPRPVYRKRSETRNIDCQRVLRGEEKYIEAIARRRPALCQTVYGMSCVEIRKRVLPPVQPPPLKFGVAHARIVYENYIFIEEELRSSYHYQNYFCYFIDKTAKPKFLSDIRKLGECIPNVFVSDIQLNIDSWGHFMNFAYYECLKILIRVEGWHYALLLQNYDLVLKSVQEIVDIYDELGGVNDVSIRSCTDLRCDALEKLYKWDARSLRMFRNGSYLYSDLNSLESAVRPSQLNGRIKIAKGSVQASLSRAAVDWMINIVNISTLLHQLNREDVYGTDELLLPSLQISDDIDMPGRFTSKCIQKPFFIPGITRLSYWVNEPKCGCSSGMSRNRICILGIEDLESLSKTAKIMVLPSFDYAIVDCVHEIIFNKTYGAARSPELDTTQYRNLVHVQYHRRLISLNNSDLHPEVQCDSRAWCLKNMLLNSERKCRIFALSSVCTLIVETLPLCYVIDETQDYRVGCILGHFSLPKVDSVHFFAKSFGLQQDGERLVTFQSEGGGQKKIAIFCFASTGLSAFQLPLQT